MLLLLFIFFCYSYVKWFCLFVSLSRHFQSLLFFTSPQSNQFQVKVSKFFFFFSFFFFFTLRTNSRSSIYYFGFSSNAFLLLLCSCVFLRCTRMHWQHLTTSGRVLANTHRFVSTIMLILMYLLLLGIFAVCFLRTVSISFTCWIMLFGDFLRSLRRIAIRVQESGRKFEWTRNEQWRKRTFFFLHFLYGSLNNLKRRKFQHDCEHDCDESQCPAKRRRMSSIYKWNCVFCNWQWAKFSEALFLLFSVLFGRFFLKLQRLRIVR